MNYDDFLSAKIPMAQSDGFTPISEPHPSLFPHQRDIARWAALGGRRAVFAAFGLGKSRIHLQIAKWITEIEPDKKYLIIAPLGVRQEFTRSEGPAMGLTITYVRTNAEVAAATTRIVITNYERVRDGGITISPKTFSAVGLDEASCLRSYGSKTFQSFLRLFSKIKYRYVFTATPSPNRHKELIHYGGFLGIMDTGLALTRWFQRDAQKAGNLTLYPSQEKSFWQWLSSWAVWVQRPSDLGYSDEGYNLPPMQIHWHKVDVDHTKAWGMMDAWGQSQLFLDQSSGLKELAEVKRDTMVARLACAQEIIDDEEPEKHWILWHDLEAERRLIEKAIPEVKTVFGTQDLELREELILGFGRGDYRILATKPVLAGSGCNLQRHCADAIFLGSTYKFNDLIQACHRIYRFQQPRQVNIHIIYSESEAPVIEVLKTKWAQHNELVAKMANIIKENGLSITDMKLKRTRGCDRAEVEGKRFRMIRNDCILELQPHDKKRNKAKVPGQTPQTIVAGGGSISESQRSVDSQLQPALVSEARETHHQKEGAIRERSPREEAHLLTATRSKAPARSRSEDANLVSGESTEVFTGSEVQEPEAVLRNLTPSISGAEKDSAGEMRNLQTQAKDTSPGPLPQNGKGARVAVPLLQSRPGILQGQSSESEGGDSLPPHAPWPDNCVDMICTSIPFGNQYEYSPAVEDLGHNPSNEDFFKQMAFLIPNLLRVLRPGRVAAIHVKDRIRFGNVTGLGMPTVDRFSDKTADCFEKAGFQFFGRITIDTDVVRENNQTYRLGWTENSKDSTKMGVGCPEYVLLLRKLPTDLSNAYADVPVKKDKAEYTRSDWQIDASSLWKSNGNRLPDPEILINLPHDAIGQIWKAHCQKLGYDWMEHVELGRALEKEGRLPASYMLFPPISKHPSIWTDIVRMRVLNSEQERRNEVKHVCPMQLDALQRLIRRYTNANEVVLDPFAGIGTTAYVAVKEGRIGWGIELASEYWRCAVGYCEQAEAERITPTLFDLAEFKPNLIQPAAA